MEINLSLDSAFRYLNIRGLFDLISNISKKLLNWSSIIQNLGLIKILKSFDVWVRYYFLFIKMGSNITIYLYFYAGKIILFFFWALQLDF